MKTKHPTIYVTKQELQRRAIDLSVFPNAGPRPNITGMRRGYYGVDAYLVKHGEYVYNVTPDIYYLLLRES